MHWDRILGVEDFRSGLPWVHRGGQRARRLEVQRVDHRVVGGQERRVEWAEPACDEPPETVEHRVAAVENALSVGFDCPVQLRVAQSVDRGERGDGERLRAVCTNSAAYLEEPLLPGGCLMTAALTEYGGRPGRGPAMRWPRCGRAGGNSCAPT
ncbi:TetR family transcriptional regulator C-terminal domain-containing protein [Amycolatopsis sp. A1MSW2902]|uniref:TetR family transcriptional regulator C-terminal domain-containing protein n=1 Tax=Amycolatopsis sp. A1MSW2902 TaxID=687413 RepID=UPI003FCDDCD9